MIIYGIPNCDTVAKARKYLEQNGISHQFHDVRTQGIDSAVLTQAYAALGEKLFNTRSPSWRTLDADQQSALKSGQDFAAAIETPTVIKRPLVITENDIFNGFKAEDWQARGL